MKGLIVDIDDTLSKTTKYWIEVFQQNFGNEEGLSIDDMYRKYHYVQNVPYWNGPEVSQLIHKYIHSNYFQLKLPLIDNANYYLTLLSKEVPIICYLTKRPEIVRSGTSTWLIKHNFPKAPLIMKPTELPDNQGNQWKSDFIQDYRNQEIGIIDDDKNLVELLKRDRNIHYFLFGIENYFIQALNVYPCVTWEILYEKYLTIKEIF